MNINDTELYRITHIDNLSHILRNGLFSSNSSKIDPNFKAIGNLNIIGIRKNRPAPNPPGGYLGDYVPFYFGKRSPMLYNIATGWEDILQIPQEEIIYLVVTVGKVLEYQLQFFFTDGHVVLDTSIPYTDPKDLSKLDWNAINARQWTSDDDDLRRKEKKQSEFLIKDHVPLSCITKIVTYNESAERIVRQELEKVSQTDQIEVLTDQREYYYANV